MMCPMWGLDKEIVDHIIWRCRMSIQCWAMVGQFTRVTINGREKFQQGSGYLIDGDPAETTNVLKARQLAELGGFGRVDEIEFSTENLTHPARYFQAALDKSLEQTHRLKTNFREFLSNTCPNCYITITVMCLGLTTLIYVAQDLS